MTQKKVFILLGHPDKDTRSGRVASAYEEGALEAGHEVRRLNLGEMKFDPILHFGYKTIQPLEPDLITFQQNVKWCDHFVIVYPNWWSTMPALLKGLIDRAWLPGFAFSFYKDGRWGWLKRMKGKSARVIILMNNYPWTTFFLFGEFTNELARATLGFAGFHPVHVTSFAPSEKASPARFAWWLQKARRLGQSAK